MNIVFLGSDDISCGFLEALLTAPEHSVHAVVTQPRRPAGRNLTLRDSPIHTWMQKRALSIPVLTPGDVNTPESLDAIRGFNPDVVVVVAYGQFLGQALLDMPPHGCLNIHLSLLPKLRGAAPIHRAMLQGFATTGVTAMHMDIGMDSGDIYGTREVPILSNDTHASLTATLIDEGCKLLLKTLDDFASGTATRTPQDHTQKTTAKKVKKADWTIDWTQPAEAIERAVRTFYPRPGTIAYIPNSILGAGHFTLIKIFSALVEGTTDQPPGTVISLDASGPLIACGDGTSLRLLEIHPEGKPRPISGNAFVNGYKNTLSPGDRLKVE